MIQGSPGIADTAVRVNALLQIEEAGFALIPKVYSPDECGRFAAELHAALVSYPDQSAVLRREQGGIYGARNLTTLFPPALVLWQREPLVELLTAVLGREFGLVRGLFFDKPPDSNWNLPWHQDLTIAVADHSLPSQRFCKRTLKAGVPHVEAPDEILRGMLTLRIHLDDVTPANGPLQVLPATHLSRACQPQHPPVAMLAAAGDVLAMRPLLSHCSGASMPGTALHRRIIHLEFATREELPDGYRWQEFARPAVGPSQSPRLERNRITSN